MPRWSWIWLVSLVIYTVVLAATLLMLVQVRRFYVAVRSRAAGWFIWGGGSLLVGAWGAALLLAVHAAWG